MLFGYFTYDLYLLKYPSATQFRLCTLRRLLVMISAQVTYPSSAMYLLSFARCCNGYLACAHKVALYLWW